MHASVWPSFGIVTDSFGMARAKNCSAILTPFFVMSVVSHPVHHEHEKAARTTPAHLSKSDARNPHLS